MAELEDRLDRIEQAVSTMAWWLVQAQWGFGEQDAHGIDTILWGKDREFAPVATRPEAK